MGEMNTAGVLRLRAKSAVTRDKSVRRFAQDDDFVGVLTKNILNELAWDGVLCTFQLSLALSNRGSHDSAVP